MAVVVTEAAIVLMFSKKKDDGRGFFVLGVRFLGRVGTIAIFFVTLA